MKSAIATLILLLSSVAATTASEGWQEAALKVVRADRDVAEAMFPMSNILWISVKDDGTRRDGLAQAFCLDVLDAGLPAGKTITIRILNLANLDQTLGRTICQGGK